MHTLQCTFVSMFGSVTEIGFRIENQTCASLSLSLNTFDWKILPQYLTLSHTLIPSLVYFVSCPSVWLSPFFYSAGKTVAVGLQYIIIQSVCSCFVFVVDITVATAAFFGVRMKKNQKEWKSGKTALHVHTFRKEWWKEKCASNFDHFKGIHMHIAFTPIGIYINVRLLLLLYNNNIWVRVAWLAWSIAEYAYKHKGNFTVFDLLLQHFFRPLF